MVPYIQTIGTYHWRETLAFALFFILLFFYFYFLFLQRLVQVCQVGNNHFGEFITYHHIGKYQNKHFIAYQHIL